MDTPALTLGESLAHVSRTKRWEKAVLLQISAVVPTLLVAYAFMADLSPSFFTSVPWRLPLLLSYQAYWSVLGLILSYADLFLPRTPVAVVENLWDIGWWAVGLGVLNFMVSAVLGTAVEDTRVLVGCTCVVAVFIAGLVAFWVWLARTYGGASESSTVPSAEAGQQPPRVPI